MALSLAAILPFVYGMKELARHGWQPLPIVAVVAGVVFAMWFARRPNALADPLLDLRLFTNPQFSISLGGPLSSAMLNGATMVFAAQAGLVVTATTLMIGFAIACLGGRPGRRPGHQPGHELGPAGEYRFGFRGGPDQQRVRVRAGASPSSAASAHWCTARNQADTTDEGN